MNNGVIIRKFPGQVVPRGYLQEALKNAPHAFGISIQDKDEAGNALLETVAEKSTVDVDKLFATVEASKEVPMFLHLARLSENFDPVDDLQPFNFQMAVEGEAPEDILSVFVEGDFPNYSVPKGGHTDEYNLWEKLIFPMLEEKFDLANSDPEDFYARLRSSTTEQTIMNAIGHRGVVVFVPMTGEPICYGRNELGGEWDWGTASNRFGWGDQTMLNKAAETAIAAVKKGGGRLQRLMSTSSAAPPASPAEIKKDDNGIHHVGNTTHHDTTKDVWKNWPGTSAKTHTMTAVPKKLQGNARNRWIRLFTNNPNGDLPKDKDKDGFMIPVENKLMAFAQEDVDTNDAVRTLASSVKHFQTSGVMRPAGVTNEQIKEATEIETQHTAAPPKEGQRPAADYLPDMSAETKKGAVDLVTDWATQTKRPTKLEIQRIESKYPAFSVTTGIKFEDMLGWTIADKKALAKKYPDAMALAFTELQLKLLELGVGMTVTEPKKQDEPAKHSTQVEVPHQKPEAAPTGRKSRLAQLSGKAA